MLSNYVIAFFLKKHLYVLTKLIICLCEKLIYFGLNIALVSILNGSKEKFRILNCSSGEIMLKKTRFIFTQHVKVIVKSVFDFNQIFNFEFPLRRRRRVRKIES